VVQNNFPFVANHLCKKSNIVVEGIGDKNFHGESWHDGHIGPIISTWITHEEDRHLGIIECLVGVQGIHGSADN